MRVLHVHAQVAMLVQLMMVHACVACVVTNVRHAASMCLVRATVYTPT
jgi:hypothetical protein